MSSFDQFLNDLFAPLDGLVSWASPLRGRALRHFASLRSLRDVCLRSLTREEMGLRLNTEEKAQWEK